MNKKNELVDGYVVTEDKDNNLGYYQNTPYLPHTNLLLSMLNDIATGKERRWFEEYKLLSEYDRIEIEDMNGNIRSTYVDKDFLDIEPPEPYVDNKKLMEPYQGANSLPIKYGAVPPSFYKNKMFEESILWDPPKRENFLEKEFGRVYYAGPNPNCLIAEPVEFENPIRDMINMWVNNVEHMVKEHPEEKTADVYKIIMDSLGNCVRFKYCYRKRETFEVYCKDVLIDCLNKIDKTDYSGTTGNTEKDNRLSYNTVYIQILQYINEIVKYAYAVGVELPPFEDAPLSFILGPNETVHGIPLVGDATIEITNIEKLLNILNEGE